MKTEPTIETHYIIIGSLEYQIVFDAANYSYDILIRGKFEWDLDSLSQVNKIDFMHDNLNDIEEKFHLTEAHWCADQNRIELHLQVGSSYETRSTASETIPNGFDFEEMDEMELVLRIGEDHEVCGEFVLFRSNKDEPYNYGVKQKDKDGSILIGMSRP